MGSLRKLSLALGVLVLTGVSGCAQQDADALARIGRKLLANAQALAAGIPVGAHGFVPEAKVKESP